MIKFQVFIALISRYYGPGYRGHEASSEEVWSMLVSETAVSVQEPQRPDHMCGSTGQMLFYAR